MDYNYSNTPYQYPWSGAFIPNAQHMPRPVPPTAPPPAHLSSLQPTAMQSQSVPPPLFSLPAAATPVGPPPSHSSGFAVPAAATTVPTTHVPAQPPPGYSVPTAAQPPPGFSVPAAPPPVPTPGFSVPASAPAPQPVPTPGFSVPASAPAPVHPPGFSVPPSAPAPQPVPPTPPNYTDILYNAQRFTSAQFPFGINVPYTPNNGNWNYGYSIAPVASSNVNAESKPSKIENPSALSASPSANGDTVSLESDIAQKFTSMLFDQGIQNAIISQLNNVKSNSPSIKPENSLNPLVQSESKSNILSREHSFTEDINPDIDSPAK